MLNEPEILNSLAQQERPDPLLADALLRLLTKPREEGETVLVKPSNFPNRLMPFLLEAKEEARAVIVTNTLREFLEAVARKGLMGRQWGRQVYFAAASYAGRTEEFAGHVPGMTDLQVAAFGWLLTQNWFQSKRLAPYADRIEVLHSLDFIARRGETIASASAHLGLGLEQQDFDAIMNGPVFETDAKTGVDYSAKAAADEARYRSAVLDEEIEEVAAWIADLARVSGIKAPVGQTLL